MGSLPNSRGVVSGGVLRKTLLLGLTFALGMAFLVFVGWQVAAFLEHLGERPIRIVTGFEGSPATKVTKVSDTHWLIGLEDPDRKRPHFFLFRVEGAAGRTMTFEIPNATNMWRTLNPVYSYASSLDDLATFSSVPVTSVNRHFAPNSSELPDTSGQGWQFIEDAQWRSVPASKWQLLREGKWGSLINNGPQPLNKSFQFSQKLDQDAYVCMRYPYTPGYNQRYLDSLTNHPAVQVITVGTSKEGRPLEVVKISEGGEAEEKLKPCVLIYAREKADEQDSSWGAQGAIKYLISDAFKASELRRQFTFLVIPLLDPDGAAMGVHEHITYSFLTSGFEASSETPESTAYAAFFKNWMDKGNLLQLVLNLHNLESNEGPHLQFIVVEPVKQRREYSLMFYDRFLQPLTKAEGFSARRKDVRIASARLGIWLSNSFGPLHALVDINAQEPHRHLTIADLHQIGQLLVLASARFLSSQEAGPFMASVDAIRHDRAARWQKYGSGLQGRSALEAERECNWRAASEPDAAKWEALRARSQR